VNAALPSIRGRLDEVRVRIAEALRRSGRPPGRVRLIAVVKSVSVEAVREAVDAGVGELGENRVQEAEEKIGALGPARVGWHMIGHLQRNKAARAATLFDRIQSIDDVALARSLSRRAMETGRTIAGLIQVNVSGEASKHGVAPSALEPLIAEAIGLPGLAIDGLMSIGPAVERGDEARPYFERTRLLRDAAAARLGVALPELSMGMSGDFEAAIEEGSTMVRLGTALFGTRR
jgi:pyridoxal phosphate enzyme (YggS family)